MWLVCVHSCASYHTGHHRQGTPLTDKQIHTNVHVCTLNQHNRTCTRTPHYTTLHYTTLHYTTLHHTTLHYTTLHYTTLHYTTLHYTPPHYTTPQPTVLTVYFVQDNVVNRSNVRIILLYIHTLENDIKVESNCVEVGNIVRIYSISHDMT